VLTTGMGETTSDYLVHRIAPAAAVGLGAIGFVAALLWQLSAHRYLPWRYWSAVVMVSVFGTMAADVLHVGLGIAYPVSTIFFVVALAAIFATWHRTEGTLSVHGIVTARRELFYWAAVLGTFALGTALSDMTAMTLHLGWFASGVMFAGAIGLPALAHWRFRADPILTFWTAYVLTRPLGASFADWFGLPHSRKGLGWGTGPVSIALFALIVGIVGYLAVTHADEPAL
jgi:uncharacterized membrane-anchored protein